MNTHEKKVALVTGSSRGLGCRIAKEFASAGYAVGVNYNKSGESADEFVRELRGEGFRAQKFRADVARSSDVFEMTESVIREFGRIDVVVNNAAIIRDRAVVKMSDGEWDDVIGADLSGAFYVTREAAKVMSRQKSGSIINISSIVGWRGNFGEANYSSAKGGLISLTKTAARELGRFGVRVNCVLPGFHLTDMGSAAPEEYYRKNIAESVLGVTTSDEEFARFVVFISELTTVSGQIFNVDSRII
ncbi:MAG: SDR family NAD(P)-dependent oxidoreductase [Endomicrobiia bacterium]|nr:SDR family NAD(P)-dependent oxidoreductase [Endomicrobiia bacterium]